MVLLVLLLFCSCLGCLREGVWTQYTPADVARWQAQSVQKAAAPRLPTPTQLPEPAPFPRSFSGPGASAARRSATPAAPATQLRARLG